MSRFWIACSVLCLSFSVSVAGCVTHNATSLTLHGLWHENDYNGEFHRGADAFNLNGQPTFWQNPASPDRTCGHILDKFVGRLEAGECTANSWISLPDGDASPEACMKSCESQHVNGCCRWRPGSSSNHGIQGCSMGHGRTSYMEGGRSAARLGGNTSFITRCSGRAFIFYCPAVNEWNMAPPSAWDVIDHGGCYDTVKRAYYHSVVLGSPDLAAGFRKEWGWKNTYGHYVDVKAPIRFKCETKSPPLIQSKSEGQLALRAEGEMFYGAFATSFCQGVVVSAPVVLSALLLRLLFG